MGRSSGPRLRVGVRERKPVFTCPPRPLPSVAPPAPHPTLKSRTATRCARATHKAATPTPSMGRRQYPLPCVEAGTKAAAEGLDNLNNYRRRVACKKKTTIQPHKGGLRTHVQWPCRRPPPIGKKKEKEKKETRWAQVPLPSHTFYTLFHSHAPLHRARVTGRGSPGGRLAQKGVPQGREHHPWSPTRGAPLTSHRAQRGAASDGRGASGLPTAGARHLPPPTPAPGHPQPPHPCLPPPYWGLALSHLCMAAM